MIQSNLIKRIYQKPNLNVSIQILLVLISFIPGQSQLNCDSLLSKSLIHIEINNEFKWDVSSFFECGFTFEDIEIIDWELMLNYVHQKYEAPTYNNLRLSIEAYREKPEYKKAYKKIVCERIASRIPNLDSWLKDVNELVKCGLTEEDIKDLKTYLENNNWKTVFCFAELINKKPYFKMPFETSAFKKLILETSQYPKVKNEIKTSDKKVLLYFNNSQNLNCRQIEDFVLRDNHVSELINSNFSFYTFSTSDKTEIPKEEWIIEKRKTYKTIGDINMYYESSLFQNNNQPFFLVIEKGELVKDAIGFVRKIDFIKFLERNK